MKNEADVIEQQVQAFLEVEGLERPLAERLVHWGIGSLGTFFRRPSIYLADILGEEQAHISRLQNRAREIMIEKGMGMWD
jgi:hypothetical protein